jgi:ATP adenylyltransferase
MTDLEKTDVPWDDIVSETSEIIVYRDKYPVSFNHLLFVPKYNNVDTIKIAFESAYKYGLAMLDSGHIDGFNIGINHGNAAGQTIMYPHVHLIPRYEGDVKDPTGGVRNVIPGKGNYRKQK